MSEKKNTASADWNERERVAAAVDAPPPAPLTTADVQRLIDIAFVRFEQRHGHLGEEDAARKLADLSAS